MIGIGDKMKKILSDKSFWIILIISLVSLIVLTIGVVFLTKKNTKEFYSAGYIINSTANKSDKYYFDNDTVYKENIFDEYVFVDVDNKEVSTSKDNFIHYLDNSLSFMKNGVILDLDNFNENIVPYYNITDKSIIKYNNGGYYVETADKTLVFGNFLGRIADNKYIVAGNNIKVKLAGNDESVSGDYFEILFVENGIVKVENQEGSYQTVSDGTIIYIGDDIKINLGDKNVIYGDNVKLSLSELTIDGNENIDIVPEEGLVDKNEEDNSGTNDGSSGNDPQKPGTNDIPNVNDTPGDTTDPGKEDDVTTILKKEVSVSLIEASSDVNSIKAKFQIIDTADAIKGNLVLTVINTTTGETVYTKILADTYDEQLVAISSLESDCNYVMTIVDENNDDSVQYFQKSFRTEALNLKLKREMVTETSLTYSLDFSNDNDVVAADITLVDENNNETSYTVNKDSDTTVTFNNLKHNTLYNVIVDNVVIKNVQYDKLYTSKTSDLTLKNKPTLGEISVKINNDTKNFTLKMDSVNDEDKAIVKYTYQIFEAEDITEETITTAVPVYSFMRNELDDEILKLDEAKNLYGNKDYRFKIVAQYYDNYRYNEIETKFSDYFQIVGKPTISFNPSEIDINRIAGTVIIDDVDCTIPFEGRECSDAPNNFIIRYYGGTTAVRNSIENVVVDNENQTLSFDLNGLTENTLYTFEVYADIDLDNGEGLQTGQYIGGFNVSTKGISALVMQNWKKNGYSFNTPISVNTEMISTTPDDDSIDKLSSITFNLYSGDVSKTIDYSNPIASYTADENVKDLFYNKQFPINSNMFEYNDIETSEMLKIENLDVLKELSGGRLNRYYTIEVTDAFDETGTNEFAILNNVYVYETPSILLLEDEVTPPEIVVEEITNIQTESGEFSEKYGINYISELDDEIVRGYRVTAVFDKNKIESYFKGSYPITKINFYANNSAGSLIEKKTINFAENEEYSTYFFLETGTDYNTIDNDMRRGNSYKFSFDITIDEDGDPSTDDLFFPSSRPTSDEVIPVKQKPSFKLYIDNSTESSVTYKYSVYDYDNALYMDEDGNYYFYYSINGHDEGDKVIFVKDGSSDTFTLSNLDNSSIYTISYYSATIKKSDPAIINIGSYYFDGYYNASDYSLKYRLEYQNFSNILKIIIEDNEFLNRISAYLLTLTSGDDKYQTVVTDLKECVNNIDGTTNKCIEIDYSDIVSLKGKNITVSLEAFYDTGYVGFGQASKLDSYFKNLNLVDKNNTSKVGYVYQTTGVNGPGKYFYVGTGSYSILYDTPKGILAYEFVSTDNFKDVWKLSTSNLVDIRGNKFVSFGDISYNNTNAMSTSGSIGLVDKTASGYTVNPKVLDKMTFETDDNSFKFTSIIPKVRTSVKSLINGATMNIMLSIDPDTLATDYVKTDGKYKFYIEIKKLECLEGEECDEPIIIETDYDSLSEVTFVGLSPDTDYSFRILADMNKNGNKVKTPLFDYYSTGYLEYQSEFSTLSKEDIFNRVNYSYSSNITEETYSHRMLNLTTFLNTKTNYDLRYRLYDNKGNLEFEKVILNENILLDSGVITAKYSHDITYDDFVFGPGYYNLVITAITTDLGKELELYNDKLIDDSLNGKNFRLLKNPTITLSKIVPNTSSITYDVFVEDIDKVIKDGIYHIELQTGKHINACPGSEKDCMATVNIKNNTCVFDNGKTTGCSIVAKNNDSQQIKITFDGLKADTNYSIYVYANTYRNNLSLTEKEQLIDARNYQYTKSNLNFSLGAVTPTAVSKTNLVITFLGAANLTDSLTGIEYDINIQGGDKVASGVLGSIKNGDTEKLMFGRDLDGYPTISIPISNGKELGLSNFIIINYYYKNSDGDIVHLPLEGDENQYTVKNES